MPTRINPITGKVEDISDEDAAILYSGPVGPTRLAASLTPGALPPLPARGRSIWEQLDEAHAPVIERNIVGEFGAGLARGLGPQSLELTGQAMRGIGLERAGEAVRGAGRAVEAAAPSVFRPSTAAQVPGSWRSNVYNAAQSVGTSLGISAPGVAAALLTGGGAAPVIGALMLSTPGVFGAAEYQTFFDEGRKAGIPDEVLRMPALWSAIAEGGLELGGNVAEALLITRGYGRLAARGLINRTKGGVKAVMIPRITQTLAEGAGGAAIEGGTEALTDVAQTQLRQGVGIPAEGQAATAFTVGAMAGAIFSGVGKGAARLQQRSQLNTLASAEAPQEARLEQMNRVVARMEEGNVDQEMIDQFSNYAADAIVQGQPIPLGEDITGLGATPAAPAPPAPPTTPPAAPIEAPPSAPYEALQREPGLLRPALPETAGEVATPRGIPPAVIVHPRGPQVPSGTANRLASPAPEVTQEPTTPDVVTPEPTAIRTPQLPPGITGRLAAQEPPITSDVMTPTEEMQPALPPAGEAGAEGVPPTSAPTPETPQGQPTLPSGGEYYTPSGGSYPFTYGLIEADDAIPSHDPQSFSPNQLYEDVAGMPLGALQDRAYHREPAEQAKVVEQDRKFPQRYGFMLSTNPDATHGPPVLPSDSNVTLAGNSRMMTILRKIQEPGQPGYEAYKNDLKSQAATYGIDPVQVDQMRAPILVRRLNDVSTNDPQAMQTAARESNESFTQALSEKAQAVASGKALSDETVSYLGAQLDAMGEDSTLRDFFRTATSRELIRRLQSDGVLTQRTINKYVGADGVLNEDGKTLVERAILGRVLPNSDLIDAAPPSTINTLIKTLPALTQLQARGEAWNITQHLPEAVQLATDTKLNGWNTINEYLKQGGLFGEQTHNPVAVAMAEQLLSGKPTQTKRAFDRFASLANRDVAGQASMLFAPPQPPGEAFNAAFGANLSAEAYQQAIEPAAPLAPATEQFQSSPQTQAQGGGEPWTLTRQEVDASFPSPGYRVLELPEGGYRISTQAGYVDLNEVDQIQMGSEQRIAFQMGYGTPYSDDVSVNARFVHQNGESRIELVKGKADRVSLLHDIEHWLEHSGQLTQEQIQQLSEATGKDEPTAEDRSEFVGRSLNDRRYRRDTAVGRLLDQIWDYLDRLLALVGIRTTRGIIRGIETGQGLSRGDSTTVPTPATAEQFQATRPTPEQAPTENKLFTEYQSFLNYANPTVEYLFRTNKAYFVKQIVSLGQLDRESAAVLQYWDDHPKDHIRVMKQWATHQQVPTRAELGALKSLAKSYADVLMAGVREGTLTNEAFIEAKDKLIGPNTIFNMTTGVFSELGRMLRMAQDLDPEARFMQLMVQKQERIGRILTPEEMAAYTAEYNKAAMTGDAADMDKFLGKVKAENPTVWDYLKEFWYGSVLSGFPTWIANPGGNTLWTTFSLGALRPVEAFLDPWIAKRQNRAPQYFMSEVLPSLMGYGRGLAQKERWKALGPGLKTGDFEMPGAAGISKMENEMEMFSSHWQHAKWQLDFPLMRKLGFDVGPLRRKLKDAFGIEPGQPINFMRTVAPIVSLGTRVMIGMDHLGRAAAYDGIIQGLVERQVAQELRAGDLTPDQATARRTALLQQAHDGDNPAGEPMRQSAALQAKEFTFQDEKSAIANFILKGRTLPIIGRPFHLLFPFVATADRLIYRALELTPIAGMILHHDELTHWKTAGPAVTSILARQMTGVFISLVMLELFRQGVLTGDIPDDPGEREAFLRAGKQPRSFKVGDTYISYQRFEPLNLMLGWLPSMVQAAQRALERDDQAGALSIIGTMGAISVKHIIEGSYFSGFNSFLTGLNRPGGDQTEAFLSRMVDSWVPFSGARRSISRAWDAYQTGEGAIVRDPQGFLQYISGASLVSDVRPRYNVFGQPIVTPGNVAAQFIPYRISVATRDPVENELARYKIYPGPPSQQDAKGNKMPQADYERLVVAGGQLIKGKLDRLVAQPFYQQLNPELREVYLRRAIRQGREEARTDLEQRKRARGLLFGRVE